MVKLLAAGRDAAHRSEEGKGAELHVILPVVKRLTDGSN